MLPLFVLFHDKDDGWSFELIGNDRLTLLSSLDVDGDHDEVVGVINEIKDRLHHEYNPWENGYNNQGDWFLLYKSFQGRYVIWSKYCKQKSDLDDLVPILFTAIENASIHYDDPSKKPQ